MKRTKALMVNLCSDNQLCDDLQRTLELIPNFSAKLHVEFIQPDFTPRSEVKISSIISETNPDIIFFILSPNHLKTTTELIKFIRRQMGSPSIVALNKYATPDEMVNLLEAGIDDFISTPLNPTDVIPRAWRLLEHKTAKNDMVIRLKEKLGLQQLIGESLPFLDEIKKIPTVAKCDATILVTGETGTGKELCARAIHYLSPRSGKPFIPFNCGAIPSELMENELFGHVQGAFTGASAARQGLISIADGGTIFMDDIDCLPSISQAKLLRFLQEKEYRQLGSAKIFHADVRVIGATNANLEVEVSKGKLRQDLYYRLNVIPITLPALRNRREDIPLLAIHFLNKYVTDFKKHITGFASGAMTRLMFYDWPGNVRELEHVVERAVLFCENNIIKEADIDLPHKKAVERNMSFKEAKAYMVNNFERSYIERLLISSKGNITRAAQAAQKDRRAFWELIRKHEIDVQKFKPGPNPPN